MDKFSLFGKVAIVTGGLGLLGRQHCCALAEAGANVVVLDTCNDACVMFAATLPGAALGLGIDITKAEEVENARDSIIERFGSIDILVNNAAINDMFENPKAALEQSKFENYPLDLWQASLQVNLTGMFLCSQVFGAVMSEKGKGSIINIASTYGVVAPDQSLYRNEQGEQIFYKPPAYSVTKGGVIAFTKYLAAYWGSKGVRVNTLSPGGVENGQSEFFRRQYSLRVPLNRMAKPDDYRGAIVFLASDASAYMTGANIIIDGGWTAW